MTWTQAELVEAVRDRLTRSEVTLVMDGAFALESVDHDGTALVVAFRWRAHPRVFEVALRDGALVGAWEGLEHPTVGHVVDEVEVVLAEKLLTGATHWAPRREREGRVRLDLSALPRSGASYGVHAPPQTSAGHLRMEVHALVGSGAHGHVDVSVTPGGTAEIEPPVVEDVVPFDDVTRLVHHALCAAAEAGAMSVVATSVHPALLAAGMRPDAGGLVLDTTAPWPLPAVYRR